MVTNLIFLYQVLKDGLSAVHVPYSYGFAIILLTVLVKIATLPLTKQQVNLFATVIFGESRETQFSHSILLSITQEHRPLIIMPILLFDNVLLLYRLNQHWQCKTSNQSSKQFNKDMQEIR